MVSEMSWQIAWMRSKDNPLLFVTDVLGAIPEPWQADALIAVGKHDPVSIRSGRGKDDARSVVDPVVPVHAHELQDPCSGELSGPAARHRLA
jgi:hypothetical protein